MSFRRATAAYKKVSVGTARPIDLVDQLCARAVRHLETALREVEADFATALKSSRRCQDILTELLSALDPEAGPLAGKLASLYLFALAQVRKSERARKTQGYEDALQALRPLAAAWSELARSAHPTST